MRAVTGPLRVLPDFIVIGAQRSGTSSLYRYLGGHPELVPSLRKETEYFTRRYNEGLNWYRGHFPLETRVQAQARLKRKPIRSFEATPDYLFHPLAASRISKALPSAKFIVLLRDPVERSYSHYRHMCRLGFETLSFEGALDIEEERVQADFGVLADNPLHPCINALRFSYASRGLYASQLERWFGEFDKDRFLILDADSFFVDQKGVLASIGDFVEVSNSFPDHFQIYSRPTRGLLESKHEFDEETRRRLVQIYESENARLFELTGQSFSWINS